MSFCVPVLKSCASIIKCWLFCQQAWARFSFNPVEFTGDCHWAPDGFGGLKLLLLGLWSLKSDGSNRPKHFLLFWT